MFCPAIACCRFILFNLNVSGNNQSAAHHGRPVCLLQVSGDTVKENLQGKTCLAVDNFANFFIKSLNKLNTQVRVTQPNKNACLPNKGLKPVCLLSLGVPQTPFLASPLHPSLSILFLSASPPWPSCPFYQASQAMIAYLFGWYRLFPENLDMVYLIDAQWGRAE